MKIRSNSSMYRKKVKKKGQINSVDATPQGDGGHGRAVITRTW